MGRRPVLIRAAVTKLVRAVPAGFAKVHSIFETQPGMV